MFYLYEAPSLPMTPYSGVYIILIHTWKGGGGGELTRDKVRGAIVHKAGQKYQHDWLYLMFKNSIKHQQRRHLGFSAFIVI